MSSASVSRANDGTGHRGWGSGTGSRDGSNDHWADGMTEGGHSNGAGSTATDNT